MKVTQEPNRVNESVIVWVALGTALVSALGIAAAYVLIRLFGADPSVSGRSVPALGQEPAPLFDELRPGTSQQALDAERLRSYGWVDRERRIVHIPVERAMDLYLHRNFQPAEGKGGGDD